MPKYRKKPVVIEARQFYANSPDAQAVADWGGGYLTDDGHLVIHTLEGDMTAADGDSIIKGVKGEFYPCKSDIFAATYEPVEEAAE